MSSNKNTEDCSPKSIFGRGRSKVDKGKSSPGNTSSSSQRSPQEVLGRSKHDDGTVSTEDNSSCSQSTAQDTNGKSSRKKKGKGN